MRAEGIVRRYCRVHSERSRTGKHMFPLQAEREHISQIVPGRGAEGDQAFGLQNTLEFEHMAGHHIGQIFIHTGRSPSSPAPAAQTIGLVPESPKRDAPRPGQSTPCGESVLPIVRKLAPQAESS